MRTIRIFAVAAAAIALASPSLAQKSKDTLRLSIISPFPVLSPYHHSVDEAVAFYREVYERLVDYDERKREFVPSLAKSWTRVTPTTLEFDLRDDIVFHNGSKFDADDVVTTVKFISDPKIRMRSKHRYTWVKSIDKLGPYKIRIEGKRPNALDIGLIAYMFAIFDGQALDGLAEKALYGRETPYGTGPYKVVEIDRNKGITVERFAGYKGNSAYSRAPISRIRGILIPDRQTQVAQLLTGGIDIIRGAQKAVAQDLADNPNFKVTNSPSADLFMLGLDATGKAGSKPLTDHRVRKAIWMAIDRDALIKHIVAGSDAAEKLEGMCFEMHNLACDITEPPVEYDAAAAKKLLADAGYPDGFEVSYDCFTPVIQLCEAIAGHLRKVGIRASIQSMLIRTYQKRRGDKQQQLYSIYYPTALFPDAGNLLATYFRGRGDMSQDPIIHKAMDQGAAEFDLAKRTKIYQRAFNRNNEMNYVMAITSLPTVYVHTNDVRIEPGLLSQAGNTISDYFWQ